MDFSFDEIAAAYLQHRRGHDFIINDVIEAIGSLKQPRSILECGCGTGNYINRVAALTDVSCSGVDISRPMLNMASMVKGKTSYLQHDCNAHLPFSNGSFSMSFSVDFIHYINTPSQFFEEQYRILAEGGILYIATHSREDIMQQTLANYFPSTLQIELSRIHEVSRLIYDIKAAGFTNIKSYHLGETAPLTHFVIELFENKTVSVLHMISDTEFINGIEAMKRDIRFANAMSKNSYSIIIGKK